jgi:alpha-galactosidase
MKKSESERGLHLEDKLPLPSRRNVLRGALAAGAVVGSGLWTPPRATAQAASDATRQTAATYVPILDAPGSIRIYLEADQHGTALTRSGNAWHGSGCTVTVQRTEMSGLQPSSVQLQLQSHAQSVERVHIRWAQPLPAERMRVLGDAWERSYGDLAWREMIPERPLPWYALAFDGEQTHGYGVATGAASFAFWQLDAEGISLWLDVRNGGRGVLLAGRTLSMATILTREGVNGETPLDAAYALCRLMCADPRPFSGPIYGSNDWYYAYGNSSAQDILRDADLVASLAPSHGPRPFTVADDGWTNHTKFPDMPGLAEEVRKRGVRPGIWIRPLAAAVGAKATLLLPAKRFASPDEAAGSQAYDPTIEEGLELAINKIREVKGWGFELIKHDFSTYDLLGQWGFTMQASPCLPGWSFNDRSRTTAEIILSFYQSIRKAAGDAVVIGCNTVGQRGHI